MDERLYTLDVNNLTVLTKEEKHLALNALECGQVVYFPGYSFNLQVSEQNTLLTDNILDGKHKNVSFDYQKQRLGGFHQQNNDSLTAILHSFMQRYSTFARNLIETLFPQYQDALQWGRTSYRPAEVKGRVSSKRKDDTRLHVDSFPATPVNGRRILRVFTNINPYGKPRIWHLGERFDQVIARFAASIPAYNLNRAKILHWFKATKTLRSAYDHYQLHLHDQMKLNDNYQHSVSKQRVDFPAQSTWIVFTDQVSHAALGGQYLLEQTFYLPVSAMDNPHLSPLKHWEKEKSIA
ncbi:Kdo hydroxylase family protein [Legionella fairfieldensis]|uniref:Kdo hydroxylase family protein n=1 Tax=Legionella fairfieldensis TaxID=45064 RepID=UPI00048A5A55|nr:Kdo hydroxylase family protein [Legionella fairfieldensis]